jgi:hypothetical protein
MQKMLFFNHVIHNYDLEEIPLKGRSCTYSNMGFSLVGETIFLPQLNGLLMPKYTGFPLSKLDMTIYL